MRGKKRVIVLDGERLRREREGRGLSISEVVAFIAERAKGSGGGISEATYRRAESGSPLFVKTAWIVAAALDIPLEQLLVDSKLTPMLADVERFLENVKSIIEVWLKEGHDADAKDNRLPARPEFFYRQTGEWKGWSDYHGVAPDQAKWREYLLRDIFEESAFRIIESMVELERHNQPSSVHGGRANEPASLALPTLMFGGPSG